MSVYKVYLKDREGEIAMVSLSLNQDSICRCAGGDPSEEIDFATLPASDFKKLIDRVAKEIAEEEFGVDPTDFIVERLVHNTVVEEACSAI